MEYATRPSYPCPRCNSRHPHLHPSMAFEGEVEICIDDYHLIPTNQNRESFRAQVLEKRAKMAAS